MRYDEIRFFNKSMHGHIDMPNSADFDASVVTKLSTRKEILRELKALYELDDTFVFIEDWIDEKLATEKDKYKLHVLEAYVIKFSRVLPKSIIVED